VVALLAYYSIPIGRNLRGLMLGYGFYIGTNLVSLVLLSLLGHQFRSSWSYLRSTSYFVTLLIWGFSLWSYQPNPEPVSAVGLESDYQLLASRTKRLLETARAHIWRAQVHD
jgi:hypothetical protein